MYALIASVEVKDEHAYFRVKRGEVKDELNFSLGTQKERVKSRLFFIAYQLGGFP